MKGVGVGLIGALCLLGCAAGSRPTGISEQEFGIDTSDIAEWSRSTVHREGFDCPYLTVAVTIPTHPEPSAYRASMTLHRPYVEKILAHLERVGFNSVYRTMSVRLDRDGFSKQAEIVLRTQWKPWELSKKIDEVWKTLPEGDHARAEEIWNEHWQATWIVSTDILFLGEWIEGVADTWAVRLPEEWPLIAWKYTMGKQPSILDGAIRTDWFSDPEDNNANYGFSFISNHMLTTDWEFETRAAEMADWAARVFLPHARQLCADMNATLLEEEAKLERIRDQLTDEIERVRRERTKREEQRKQLELEVEEGDQ